MSPVPAATLAFWPIDWQSGSLCAELPDNEADAMFFPERGQSTKAARALCATCPVKAKSLEYALENKEQFGIWGGTSERERRKLRKRRASEAA